jgi:hypothetical protein
MSVSSWFSDKAWAWRSRCSRASVSPPVGLTVVAAVAHQLSLALDGIFAWAIAFGSFYADPDFIEAPALNRAVTEVVTFVFPVKMTEGKEEGLTNLRKRYPEG